MIAAAVFIPICAINSKTIKVAFYGVGKRVQDGVKSEIEKMNFSRVKYFELDAGAALPKNFEKTYSILIAKNSLALKRNARKFVPVGAGVMDALPSAIRRSTLDGDKNYALPILLDHFELAYYKPAQDKLKLKTPQSYGSLLRFLETVKKTQKIPLACAGGNDRDLLGFVSAMSETLYGAEEYKKMLSLVRESSALNKNALPEALTRVLDEIKAMQEKELIFPKWTKVTIGDMRFFMQERMLGATAMFLSERRDFEYNLIRYFDSSYFPRYDNQAQHGIIAPQIVAVLLTKKKNAPMLLGRLAGVDAQENLTNLSLLAPTASRAESVDRQADDIRFWAASSAAGALGGIEEECEVSSERLALLAKKIRIYLEN